MCSSNFPIWLSKEMLENILNNESKNGLIDIVRTKFSPAVKAGEHYLSTILRAEVEYVIRNNTDNNNNKLSETKTIIIKTFPPGFLKQFVEENGILTKEIKMYKNVLPIMEEIIGFKITANCLHSGEIKNNNLLILEDLKCGGFKTANRIQQLDFEHCATAIKTLAHFHASSLIINKRNRDILDEVSKEPQYHKEKVFQKGHVTNCFKIVAEAVKTWDWWKIDENGIQVPSQEYATRLKESAEKVWFMTVNEIHPSAKSDINVLNHGDFWTNNIMYKYDENHVIVDCNLVDFQFCRWTSPAFDFQLFLITSIDIENRSTYLSKLIDIYVKIFNEYITRFQLPTERMLTPELLCEDIKRTHVFGLLSAVCCLPMVWLNPENAISFDETSGDDFVNNTEINPLVVACKDSNFRKRFPKVLEFYHKIGVL